MSHLLPQKSELLEVGCSAHSQTEDVGHPLVEAGVGAGPVEVALVVILQEVLHVTHLMVH